jgi:hypothetical protein
MTDYLINMAANPEWAGEITKLEVQLGSVSGVRFEVDSIRACAGDPDAMAWRFDNGVGASGWFAVQGISGWNVTADTGLIT